MDAVVCRFDGPFYDGERDEMTVHVYMKIGDVMKLAVQPLGKRTTVDHERDILPAVHMLAAAFSRGEP